MTHDAATPEDEPLRVAVDVGPLYGHRTGVGVAVAGITHALGERLDVALTCYLTSGRARPMPGHRRLPIPGIVASHLWSRADRPCADRWLGDVDVVHGTNYVAPPSRHPTVVSVYDCWFLRHPELASAVVRRAAANLRRAIDRGAWIHTSSEATASGARELLATDRVVTVHLGPPTVREPTRVTPERVASLAGDRFVLVVGTEERRKGIPLAIAAFGELGAERSDVTLVLAGASGDDSEAISAAIAKLADPTRVSRLGPVTEDERDWLVRNAAVLAYPSVDEGFGFPVLEAQSVGTPLVATAVGSIPEVAGDGAVLVPDRTPTAFAAALGDALVGAGRLGVIEAGYRNVRRFDWAETAAGLVDLYRRAAASA
jgi:glycosyltransferase involved in cell wall biosynthesis